MSQPMSLPVLPALPAFPASGALPGVPTGREPSRVPTRVPGAGVPRGPMLPALPAVSAVSASADELGEGLICEHLTVRYRGRSEPTIRDVGLAVPSGGLLAVVGPSGSGKSTLCAAILGEVEQVQGRVLLGGVNLLQARSVGRRLVSFVPQRDALHNELTPRRALALTAALRLASRVPAAERARRVDELLQLLEIGEQASTRIGELSGGQRKRVAVAMELLSDPLLLMLDEPTSGLDEGLGRVMMLLLRRVADAGVAVMVVTHSSENLALADTVLALGSTGRAAYCGAPAGLLDALGARSYAEAMQVLRVAPGVQRRRRAAGRAHARPVNRANARRAEPEPRVGPGGTAGEPAARTAAHPDGSSGTGTQADLGIVHCTRVLTARELRRMLATPLIVARGLLLLPLLTVLLTAWADDQGLAGGAEQPNRMQGAALSVMITCITFFAMALSFSTIVGDRDVIDREDRWGVPPAAVVLSKGLALLGPVVVQTVVTMTVYLSVREGPDHALAGAPVRLVLGASLGLLGVAAMCLGLVISAASPRLDRAVFLLMGTIAVLVVLTGLLIPLWHPSGVGGHTLSMVSQFAPTRWGTAAVAAHIGFVPIEMLDRGIRTTPDPWWVQDRNHVAGAWLSLVVLALTYGLVAAQLLTRQSRRRR
jgi:ABC-type multidrug transport system ATPase subunit